jgi:hypothetical protein
MNDFQLTSDYLTQTDPVLQVRDEKLQYTISKLSAQGKWQYLRTAEQIIDPFSIASTLGAGGASSLALQECAFESCVKHVLCLLSSSENKLVSLHLSENTGELIERVGQWCQQLTIEKHIWVATPLSGPLAPHIVCDQSGVVLSAPDIKDNESVDIVLKHCAKMNTDITIITADCNEAPEQEHIPLLINQVLIALAVLRDSGIFILKIVEFYHHRTKLILWLLFSVFGKVDIVKPRATSVCDTTKYVICHQYKRQEYIDHFQELCNEVRIDDNPSLVEFPLTWSYWLTARQNAFTVIKENAQTKAVQVANMLLHKTPYLSEQSLHDLLETCWLDKNVRRFAQRYIKGITDKNIPTSV